MNYTHEINSRGERCQCGCSPVFTDNKDCSACDERYCEKRFACQQWEQCHKAYCEVCAPEHVTVCVACEHAYCTDHDGALERGICPACVQLMDAALAPVTQAPGEFFRFRRAG